MTGNQNTPTLTPQMMRHFDTRARELRSQFVFNLVRGLFQDSASKTAPRHSLPANDTDTAFPAGQNIAA